MAIVPLKKMTFCGILAEKQSVLEALQELGGTHLIPLQAEKNRPQGQGHDFNEKAADGLKFLNQCARKRHQIHQSDDFNLVDVINKLSQLQNEFRLVADECDFLAERIAAIEPWGDFEFSDLGDLRMWFYIVPKRLMKKLDKSLTYQIVYSDNIHHYVVVLASQEPEAKAIPVPRTHTGKIRLSALKKRLLDARLRLEDLQAERESMTRWISLITLSLFKNQDLVDLKSAGTMTLDNEYVFIIQAWVDEKKLSVYQKFAAEQRLAVLVSDPESGDRPPTLLVNNKNLAAGENVTGFYQTPGYFDWDPSSVVFFSFALFFAMILSDAGYAAVFALLLALKWRRMGRSRNGKRLRTLALVTVGFSLLWGILSGGYFGYSPTGDKLAASLKLVDLNDFESMMKLSIAVGTAHIALASLIKAWQKKHQLLALSSLGWALLAMGGFCYWLSTDIHHPALLNGAYTLSGLGVTGILLFSGNVPVKKPVDLLKHLFAGIKSLTGITQIFGDVLSYMRLFALGLASASLALTFNQLALQVYHSSPGVGLLFSILILLLGHSLNLVLCLMSGVVHGLRLNFIEFYNWSVSDEGYPFKAFSKKGGN